jgi:hypothetical protein
MMSKLKKLWWWLNVVVAPLVIVLIWVLPPDFMDQVLATITAVTVIGRCLEEAYYDAGSS